MNEWMKEWIHLDIPKHSPFCHLINSPPSSFHPNVIPIRPYLVCTLSENASCGSTWHPCCLNQSNERGPRLIPTPAATSVSYWFSKRLTLSSRCSPCCLLFHYPCQTHCNQPYRGNYTCHIVIAQLMFTIFSMNNLTNTVPSPECHISDITLSAVLVTFTHIVFTEVTYLLERVT